MNSKNYEKRSKGPPKKKRETIGCDTRFYQDVLDKEINTLTNMSKEDKTSIVSRAKGVVEQYGSYLKEHTMKIKDVADPPCPKENLKIAI